MGCSLSVSWIENFLSLSLVWLLLEASPDFLALHCPNLSQEIALNSRKLIRILSSAICEFMSDFRLYLELD